MEIQGENGPDRGWSWMIAFAAFLISLILVGTYRTSGILLVTFVNEYGGSREDSSWPLFVCYSLIDMSGIIVGPLGQHFGIRPIIIAGALISTLGVSLCYFARSLTFLTISFGVIFGIGFGLTYHLMQVIINQYFLKYRTTASGFANSGASFGSVILPVLFEHLIFLYGLNNSMLLIGGLILQLAISGALMKPPLWLEANKNDTEINNISLVSNNDFKNIKYSSLITNDFQHNSNSREESMKNQDVEIINDKNSDITISNDMSQNVSGKCVPMENAECIASSNVNSVNSDRYNKDTAGSFGHIAFPCNDNFKHKKVINLSEEETCTTDQNVQKIMVPNSISFRESIHRNALEMSELEEEDQLIPMVQNIKVVNQNKNNVFKRFLGFKSIETDKTNSVIKINTASFTKANEKRTVVYLKEENDNQNEIESVTLRAKQFDSNSKEPEDEVRMDKKGLELQKKNKNWSLLRSYRHVFSCPMFYVLAISNTLFFCKEAMFYVINVDFYMDKGVAESDTKYMMFAYSVSDLVGRICFGWITDRKFLRKSHFMMICMMIVAVVFFIFPFADGFVSLIILNSIYGVNQGCTTVVSLVIPADYLDRHSQAVAYGCMAFLNGLTMLTFSYLIGHFRDNLGSYSSIFYILGSIALGAASLLPLENCFVKKKNVTEIEHFT